MRENRLLVFLILIIIAVPVALRMSKIIKNNSPEINTLLSSPGNQGQIRPPAVAGSFYPADQDQLNNQLTTFLDQAALVDSDGKLRLLIVPHAGTIYSGQTAAWGFKQLQNQNFSRLIILGASHKTWFDHAAVDDQNGWETPLGTVRVDKTLVANLIDKDQKIVADSQPHLREHSLELELIFLQKVLQDFTIVPILISQPSDQLVEDLAQKISLYLDDRTLLVASTDLSHYPTWETANNVDKQTIEAILTGQKANLEETIKRLEKENHSGLDTAACGFHALRVALRVAEILQISDLKKIRYENSGDVSGDQSRVVGYASIGGWSTETDPLALLINQEAQNEALVLARETLESHLNKKPVSKVIPGNEILNQPLGAFVTLRTKDHQLRGCVGEFEPKDPLYQVIQRKAIDAATNDQRFPPVKLAELDGLTIEISVISPRKKILRWQEIELGKHGVVIQKGGRTGTFLPQVASETGWTLEEFLGQLCIQKAGLPADCYQDPSVSLSTFTAFVFEEQPT